MLFNSLSVCDRKLLIDALGYLLEATHLQGQIQGILLEVKELLNLHFANDSMLTPKLTQDSIEGILCCLENFARALEQC
jgi:hypothetical protein